MKKNNKTKYTIEKIKNAPKSSELVLEEAVFPCYGVRCVYGDGRDVDEYYPEGMEDPGLPTDRKNDKSKEGSNDE